MLVIELLRNFADSSQIHPPNTYLLNFSQPYWGCGEDEELEKSRFEYKLGLAGFYG